MNLLQLRFITYALTVVLHVLTIRKTTNFYSYERVESTKCTEELSQEASYSSQAPEEEIFQEASCSSQGPDAEISSDGLFHPPPPFCFPKTKMGSRERPCQPSRFQKFP